MAVFRKKKTPGGDVWARPEMLVTFRAEIMPGVAREDRTFRVRSVLPTGRVTLYDFEEEHGQNEFEPVKFRTAKNPE